MVTVHQQLLAGVPKSSAFVLDSPYGFQVNADDLTDKQLAYFKESVGRSLDVVTLRDYASDTERATAISQLGTANWIFAGPGSPTYALDIWQQPDVRQALASVMSRGTLVLASAAALTVGSHTVPVYEIYKVGQKPAWREGLGLLEMATGLRAAVIPHFNNAEGGRHDTRYCYMGLPRLEMLEAALPDAHFVLGIDEHTGLEFDLDAQTARVFGRGAVTVRAAGEEVVYLSGSEVTVEQIASAAAVSRTEVSVAASEAATEVLDPRRELLTPFVEALLEQRNRSRADKRWADADAVRDLLIAQGVLVEDSAAGTTWRLAD